MINLNQNNDLVKKTKLYILLINSKRSAINTDYQLAKSNVEFNNKKASNLLK